jgi:hypothetical protein
MFQFSGFASTIADRWYRFTVTGCPIRTSADQFVFANPRSFSQLITSFFASESLGIPHTLLFTSFNIYYLCARAWSMYHYKNQASTFTTLSPACQWTPLYNLVPEEMIFMMAHHADRFRGWQRDNESIWKFDNLKIISLYQLLLPVLINFWPTLLVDLFSFFCQLSIMHCQLFCGEYRSRTDDLLLAKQAL